MWHWGSCTVQQCHRWCGLSVTPWHRGSSCRHQQVRHVPEGTLAFTSRTSPLASLEMTDISPQISPKVRGHWRTSPLVSCLYAWGLINRWIMSYERLTSRHWMQLITNEFWGAATSTNSSWMTVQEVHQDANLIGLTNQPTGQLVCDLWNFELSIWLIRTRTFTWPPQAGMIMYFAKVIGHRSRKSPRNHN